MSAATWPQIVTALIAALGDIDGLTVVDGPPQDGDRYTNVIFVGNSYQDTFAGQTQSQYATIGGPAAGRDETGEVKCTVEVQTGDRDLVAARSTLGETVEAVQDQLRANPGLSVAEAYVVEVAATTWDQGFTEHGTHVIAELDITYQART